MRDPLFDIKTRKILAAWFFSLLLMSLISFWLMPVREDLRERVGQIPFWLGMLVWLPAVAVTGALAFRKPSKRGSKLKVEILWVFAPLLLVMIRMHQHTHLGTGVELAGELDFYRGRCGIIILTSGVLTSVFAFTAIRKLCSLAQRDIGGWALVSSGAFASCMMNFFCAHENPLHLFIWHFLPIMFLAIIALRIEKGIVSSIEGIKSTGVSARTGNARQSL